MAIEALDAVAVVQAWTEGVVAAKMGTMRSVPERDNLLSYLKGTTKSRYIVDCTCVQYPT